MCIAQLGDVRALRVLLATLVAVPLFAYSVSEAAIAWVLRDVERPARPKLAPTLAHRGLACVEGTGERFIARYYGTSGGGRTMELRLRELALSVWLRRRFDPDELIRLQGDTMWFGRGSPGLEAGSQAWFGRPLRELTPAQAALLVGLAQGPARLDPTKHPEKAAQRRQFVLGKWQTCGLVPPGSAIAIHGTSAMNGVVAQVVP